MPSVQFSSSHNMPVLTYEIVTFTESNQNGRLRKNVWWHWGTPPIVIICIRIQNTLSTPTVCPHLSNKLIFQINLELD